jgi:hypothetical protein
MCPPEGGLYTEYIVQPFLGHYTSDEDSVAACPAAQKSPVRTAALQQDLTMQFGA